MLLTRTYLGLTFILVILTAIPPSNASIKPSFIFKKWNEASGLINDHVNQVIEDKSGFIWIATEGGLSRFDGLTFKHYHSGNSTLTSNSIVKLFLDNQNNLWVGTTRGLFVLNIAEDILKPVIWKESTDLSDLYVATIYQLDPNFILVSNLKGEIIQIEMKNQSFLFQSLINQAEFTISNILQCQGQKIFIGGNKGIKVLDLVNNQIIENDELISDINRRLTSSVVDLKCESEQLYVLTHNELLVVEDNLDVLISNSSEVLQNALFKSLNIQSESIWISTYKLGLIKYDMKSEKLSVISSKSKSSIELPSNYLESTFTDSNSSLWVSTRDKGVALLSNYDRFINSYLIGDDYNCLNGSGVYALFKSESRLLIGTLNSPLVEFDFDSQECREVFDSNDVQVSSIISIEENKDNYWFGTAFDGLYQVNKLSGKVTHYNESAKGDFRIPQDTITSLLYHKGSVWFSSFLGLGKLENGKVKFFRFPSESGKSTYNRIYHLELGLEQNLWLGTAGGMARFNLVTESFDLNLKINNTNPVYAIKQLANDLLWYSVEDEGLFYFDESTGKISPFKLPPNLSIYHIESDLNKNIWLATSNGIFSINSENFMLTHITSEFPLQGEEFSTSGYFDPTNNELGFGGLNGVSIIYPESMQIDKRGVAPLFTELTVLNKNREFKNSKRYSNGKPIYLADKLTFDHDDEFITLSFSAMEYVLSESTRYRYHLKGFHDDWYEVEPGNHQLKFSRLPAGDYELSINATEPDGQWSEQIKKVEITVHPPLWLTWWAKTLYIVLISVTLFCIYLYRTRSLRKQAEILSTTVEQRTQELQQEKKQVENLLALKNYEFANVSHEFRTPLTLILGPLKKLITKENDDNKRNTLSLVKRNGFRLLRMVDQLIYMERFRALKEAKRVDVDLQQLVKLLVEAFSDLCEEKGVTIKLLNNDDVWVRSAPDAIERILLNLLSNAYKYTPKGGSIDVSSYRIDSHQSCFEVKDSGIGIPQENLGSIFNRYERVLSEQSEAITGAGIGLALVKELVSEHHGSIAVESELGVGTTFKVILPTIEEPVDKEASRAQLTSIDSEFEGLREQGIGDEYTSSETQNASEIIEGEQDELNRTLTGDDSKPLILVIEDNRDMCDYIVSSLQPNYQTITAKNGAVGIELATKYSPDLIISDVMMPEKDGFEVCASLKQEVLTSHIPIILLTARGDRESRLTGWELNADEYLTKPFDEEELSIRVMNLLNIRSILKNRFARAADEASLKTLVATEGELNSVDSKFLGDLETYVSEHFGSPDFNVQRLAELFAISDRQLSRKVKSVIDSTPLEYIRNFRLRQAEKMLKEGIAIKTVAFDCGFSSVGYFSNSFKAFFGVTPKQMQQ